MAISSLVVRSGVGSWTSTKYLITRGLDSAIPNPISGDGLGVQSLIFSGLGVDSNIDIFGLGIQSPISGWLGAQSIVILSGRGISSNIAASGLGIESTE